MAWRNRADMRPFVEIVRPVEELVGQALDMRGDGLRRGARFMYGAQMHRVADRPGRNVDFLHFALDHLADAFQIERFGQNVVEVLAIVDMTEQALHVGGDRDEARLLARSLSGAERICHLQAVHLGQMEVHQDHIVVLLFKRFERILSVRRDIDFMAALIEQKLEKVLCDLVVFGD